MIGVFTIDIGKVKNDLREERTRETAIMEDVLEKLKNIVANPNMAIPSYGGQADKEGTMVNLDVSNMSIPYSDDGT